MRGRPEGYKSVAATCPSLDKLRKLIKVYVHMESDKVKALALIEQIRADNTQLRENAALYERTTIRVTGVRKMEYSPVGDEFEEE